MSLGRIAAIGAFLATMAGLSVIAQPDGGELLKALRTQGESAFQGRCAKCHEPAVGRAPDKAALAGRSVDEIITALRTGTMAPMAGGMSDVQIAAVAYYLTGKLPGGPAPAAADPAPCPAKTAFTMAGPAWNGWSPDPRNWRYQADPGLNADDTPRLKVKWAMTYVGGRYGQPTVVGGRLFLTSGSGRIYSLDAASGCLIWRFDAPAGARTSVVVGQQKAAPSGFAAYFGDFKRDVYALDAASGRLIWKTNVEDHPAAILTGSPVLAGGRLLVPVSSYEEASAAAPTYACCTFRGALVALDAASGTLLWKAYTIAQAPKPTRKNTAGVQMYGPAGAAVWSAPTIDAKRSLAYVATGDSYTDTPQDGSDAVVAVDLKTGKVRWRSQVTQGDNYLIGCEGGRKGANCPTPVGPDHDFGASPILASLPSGKDILLAGQKSGVVYGMDPAHAGKVLWSTRVGAGSALGGIEWGMAFDGRRLYVANADTVVPGGQGKPGLYALDPADGRILWSAPAPKLACSYFAPGNCFSAQSAPPSAAPRFVLAATMDGRLRAYDPADGHVLWTFDTAAQPYVTINGVKDQPGGSLDATGPTVAGGMVFIMSGYQGVLGGRQSNVLLAFSADGK